LVGAGGRAADIETLLIAVEVLERLGLRSETRITLNNVEVFNGLSEKLALDTGAREEMRRIIDTRDDSALQEFIRHHTEQTAPGGEWGLARLAGQREVIDEARRLIFNSRSRAALDALDELWGVIEQLELTDLFEIDLGDVSGLDYYTGLVFKVYVAGAGSRVGSGGRYDDLTINFGRPEPAVGFVLELDALTEVLTRRATTEPAQSHESGAMIVEPDGDAATLFREARQRRAANSRVRITQRDEG